MENVNYKLLKINDYQTSILANSDCIAITIQDIVSDGITNPDNISHEVYVYKRLPIQKYDWKTNTIGEKQETDDELGERIYNTLSDSATISSFNYDCSYGFVRSIIPKPFLNGEHKEFKAEYGYQDSFKNALLGLSKCENLEDPFKSLCAEYANKDNNVNPFTKFAKERSLTFTIETDMYNNTPMVFDINFYFTYPSFKDLKSTAIWFDFTVSLKKGKKDKDVFFVCIDSNGKPTNTLTRQLVHICRYLPEKMIEYKNLNPKDVELYMVNDENQITNWINTNSATGINCSDEDFMNINTIVTEILTTNMNQIGIGVDLTKAWRDIAATAECHFLDKMNYK